MIRILIEEGPKVLVDAVIDVPKRRVVSLKLDDEEPMKYAFIALAVLSGELEAVELLGMRGNTLLRSREANREPQTQRLTHEQMATAMGLMPCKAEWDSACEICDEASIDWMRSIGQVLSGWCNACLPTAYDDHLIEQAELDRLVEADDTLKREQQTGRPDVPTCEGGCE
jgi:hypothetical protein